jgi:hypothetical protein
MQSNLKRQLFTIRSLVLIKETYFTTIYWVNVQVFSQVQNLLVFKMEVKAEL